MDQLKSAWKGIHTDKTQHETLRSMLQERKHPVLKRIRTQMLIEVIAYSVILLVYYDFFDGDRKPLYLNVLLAGSLLFAIIHSAIGYTSMRRKIKGDNLRQSLAHSLAATRRFAIVAIASRVATAIFMLLFFTSVITFNATKYWILAVVIVIFLVQVWVLVRMWRNRIQQLRASIRLLEGD